ncbi:MaoC family dehydratase [Rhodopila globiformis]|uniref:Acyl dehydratase n=1 Tax=Rhodopila globiformis TaxID=1071 RepID=A0A2S6NMT5_RHOGL|nr:MaoC family dehydratase [Rhodopila globiformis]PPQ37879.1 acyl dehydratase [Rhodopila globiformis]
MADGYATLPVERWFEDYTIGATYLCGSFTVSQDEIIDFATRYDPQVMHTDPVLAAQGPFGGIIASGWHSIGLAMRLLVENFLPHDNLPSPGIDELRWVRPVRPGDTLTLRATVADARRSRSKPDRGMIHTFLELVNQDNEVVMTMRPMNFVRVRTPGDG